MMEWTEEMVLEFLDLYEKEPALWDQDRHHRNKEVIYESWKRIQNSLSFKRSLSEIRKKKNILMTSYRKCVLKIITNGRSEQLFKPEWFAFEKMSSFLCAVDKPRRNLRKNEEVMDTDDFRDNDLFKNDSETLNSKEPSRILPVCENEENSVTPNANEQNKQPGNERQLSKKLNIDVIEKRMCEAYDFLKKVAAKPKVIKDESYKFCELLCFKLRSLDADSERLLRHEINMLVHHFNNWRSLQTNFPPFIYQQLANQESITNIMPVQSTATSSSHQNGSRDSQSERMLKKFAVISFPDEEETLYIVANSWLEKAEESDFYICSWPPFKGDARIKLAVLEDKRPSSSWIKCKARLIKLCSTYASAEELLKAIEVVSSSRTEILFEKKCKEIKKKLNPFPSQIFINSSTGSCSPTQSGPFICGVTRNVNESFYPTFTSTHSIENDGKSLSIQTESFVGDISRFVEISNQASNNNRGNKRNR